MNDEQVKRECKQREEETRREREVIHREVVKWKDTGYISPELLDWARQIVDDYDSVCMS